MDAQPRVRIRDHEVHAAKPALLEAGEERGPKHGVLAVAHVLAEDLTAPLGGHARGDHDRTGDGLMVHPRFDVGRVQEHVRERRVPERTLPHRCDLTVDVRTDPRHRQLRHPRLATQGLDKVIVLPGRRAGDVGGHDHPPQGPVDRAARLEELREERTLAKLGDLRLDIARRGRHRRRARAVARPAPLLRAFPTARTQPSGHLGLDQLMQRVLHDRGQRILQPLRPTAGGKHALNG